MCARTWQEGEPRGEELASRSGTEVPDHVALLEVQGEHRQDGRPVHQVVLWAHGQAGHSKGGVPEEPGMAPGVVHWDGSGTPLTKLTPNVPSWPVDTGNLYATLNEAESPKLGIRPPRQNTLFRGVSWPVVKNVTTGSSNTIWLYKK